MIQLHSFLIMWAVNHIRYMVSVFTDIHTTVTQLTSGILSLKEGVDSFYEYMCILATYEMNLLIIPPSHLRNIQLDVKKYICKFQEHLW